MTLIPWKALNNEELVCSGSYCYLGYTLQSMYAQIKYDLQKQDIKPNMGLVILFTDPITNTQVVIDY